VGHVGFDHQAGLRGVDARLLDAAVADAKAAAHNADRRFADVFLRRTQFFVNGIAGSEAYEHGIVVCFASGFGKVAIFRALRREKRELANLQFGC
jgi:predicted short-subunit dehydrogenase-like oxidoreductase (DUF2520 family)